MSTRGLLERLGLIQSETQAATANITAGIRELREGIEAARRDLARAQNNPVPRAELGGRIELWLDNLAATFMRNHGGVLARALGDPRGKPHAPGDSLDGARADLQMVAWLVQAAAKAGIPAAVAAIPDYQEGPPTSERAATIARLERELRELETREEETIDRANQVGLQIAHRPAVAQRRENEREKRKREAEAARNRTRREAVIDQRHEAPRAARCAYLLHNQRADR